MGESPILNSWIFANIFLDKNILLKEYICMDTFTALAEPSRRAIIEHLKQGPATVNTLVIELSISQPMASKHLKMLRDVGFVTMQPQGQRRWYALQHQAFQELEEWLGGFQRYWTEELDALERFLDKNPD